MKDEQLYHAAHNGEAADLMQGMIELCDNPARRRPIRRVSCEEIKGQKSSQIKSALNIC